MPDNLHKLDRLVTQKAAARLRAFCHDAALALPDRVTQIMLFGSRARGNSDRSSDYDVAVFVDNYGNRRDIDHLLADIAYSHIISGVPISPVSVPSDFLQGSSGSAFAKSLIREGLVIS